MKKESGGAEDEMEEEDDYEIDFDSLLVHLDKGGTLEEFLIATEGE